MPLDSSDQLSSYPAAGVVMSVRTGLREVRAGVEKRGGKAPVVAHAADHVAALSSFGKRDGG